MYEQQLFESNVTKWVAAVGNLISALENIYELYGVKEIFIQEEFCSPFFWEPGENVNVYLNVGESKKEIVEYLKSVNTYGLYNINVIYGEGYGKAVFWKELYHKVFQVFKDHIAYLLRSKASITSEKHVEYMLLIGGNGKAIILQGEVDKIVIPRVKSWLIAHTHPHPHCFFSAKDIASTRDLLSYQGLLSAVVTTGCLAVLYRIEDFTVEDYENLILIERSLVKGKVKNAIKILNRLNSIRFTIIGAY